MLHRFPAAAVYESIVASDPTPALMPIHKVQDIVKSGIHRGEKKVGPIRLSALVSVATLGVVHHYLVVDRNGT